MVIITEEMMIALIMDMMAALEIAFLQVIDMNASLMTVNALMLLAAPAAVGKTKDVVQVVAPALNSFKQDHAAQAVANQNHNVLLIQVAADRQVVLVDRLIAAVEIVKAHVVQVYVIIIHVMGVLINAAERHLAIQTNGMVHLNVQRAHQVENTKQRVATGVLAEIHGVHASCSVQVQILDHA